MKQGVVIKVYGRVQGVFFRYAAKKKAEELDIKGKARNEDDGSLVIEAEGQEAPLQTFIEWCRRGPPIAHVQKIELQFRSAQNGFTEFVIE